MFFKVVCCKFIECGKGLCFKKLTWSVTLAIWAHSWKKVEVGFCEVLIRIGISTVCPRFTPLTYYLHKLAKSFCQYKVMYILIRQRVDVQADLNLHCSEMPSWTFSHMTGWYVLHKVWLIDKQILHICYFMIFFV